MRRDENGRTVENAEVVAEGLHVSERLMNVVVGVGCLALGLWSASRHDLEGAMVYGGIATGTLLVARLGGTERSASPASDQ